MDTMKPVNPVDVYRSITNKFPMLTQHVSKFYSQRGQTKAAWPKWCFLPERGWDLMAEAVLGREPVTTDENRWVCTQVMTLSALGPWRYTQGIYRVDADLLSELISTGFDGPVPSERLARLPEWSIYVETPGLMFDGDSVVGFWVAATCSSAYPYGDGESQDERHSLQFCLLVPERSLFRLEHVPLGAWTVREAIERKRATKERVMSRYGKIMVSGPDADASEYSKLLGILMYICSDAPEIDDLKRPGVGPIKPEPKKTKHGWRLIPAKETRVWTVGHNIGAELRRAKTAQPGELRQGTIRPHLRRGHWHGYWKGPRTGDQEFFYRWVAPTFVVPARPNFGL